MNIIEHDSSAHRFTAEVDGKMAELTYTLAGKTMTITHTGVPPVIAGRGIAADLMRSALKAAQNHAWEVVPACSYAAEFIRRHPNEPA